LKNRVRSIVALVVLFTGLAAGVLWWQSGRSQAQLREQVLLQAEQRSLHLADAMAGQVEGLFSTLDLAVQGLRQQWARDDPRAFEAAVKEALQSLPTGFVTHVTLADAQGQVVYNSLGFEFGTNVGDRAYFIAMREGGDQLVVGEPVRSRLTGLWQFVVGRPLLRDGRFVGTLHLAVSTDFIASKLAALELSAQDVVALIHVNGGFLARSQDNAGAMGQVIPSDRPYLADLDKQRGVYRVPGLLDGTPRTYGWHRLPQSGAVVAIGLADASVLGPLAPALRNSQMLTGVLSLLLLAGGGLVAFLLWRVARSQAAAGASEARLKEAQQLAQVGSWEHDIAGDRLTWTDEVYRVLGMDSGSEPPSRQNFYERVHPEDRERVKQTYQAALDQRQLYNVTYRILLPDGSVKHVRELCVTEYEEDRPVRSLGTVQDITEVRTAQLALQQLNERLEHRVEERTRELGALNRELEAFAYSVSHDLRTPLRSIHGFASLLEEGAERLSEPERSHLQRIQQSAKRMGILITDLLTMAHLSRAAIRHTPVNLSAMARTIVDELERSDPTRQVDWFIEDGMTALADPGLMRAALQNLLGNAWKYTNQTPEAKVRFTRTGEAGGLTEFCVNDNGAGFDMAYSEQLFMPFKRLHAHHEFEGSGVGLATVQRIVQRHGGTVRGVGAVGEGAAFYFSLPEAPSASDLTTW